MSTCTCAGTPSISWTEKLFGDSVLNDQGIYESSFDQGIADPRPQACQQAVDTLRAEAQDPCNLDSPDDLQVMYRQLVSNVWNVEKGTPVANPFQKAADVLAGTATPETPTVSSLPGGFSLNPKDWGLSATDWIGIAIAGAAVLFIVVFAATR